MRVSIIGTGYVGLVTGACLSDLGVDVTCIDIDKSKIDNLRKGVLPIYEPGLDVLVIRNYKKGVLKFSTDLPSAVKNSDVVFIAVGTPSDQNGFADLSYVLNVAREIGENLINYLVVITKSTVPVGTSEKISEVIKNQLTIRNSHCPFDVCSNPEFLKEGDAISDFLYPDRIIVGLESDRAKLIVEDLYKPFIDKGYPLIFMDILSSEMTKYAANAMLATKISFMNDMALLCDKVGANINMVKEGIGLDSRIGNKFISPGIGYGGSCFPKDVKALINTSRSFGHVMKVLEAVDIVNELQKNVLFEKIYQYFNGDINGKIIAFWGLSFKPNTDDMREAPSLIIANRLVECGAIVRAHDPIAIEEAKKMLGNKIIYCEDQNEVLKGADALALITEWTDFLNPDWDVVKRSLKGKVIFDGRNIYDSKILENMGFDYIGIGQGKKLDKNLID